MHNNDILKYVNAACWKKFTGRFKSSTTKASYESDIAGFCRFTGKKFENITEADTERYFSFLNAEIENNKLKPLTVTKKFRELHSFASFCIEFDGKLKNDYFYPYLRLLEKEKKNAKSISLHQMDALLDAASDNIMEYSILALMYRAGLTSAEVIGINGNGGFFSNGNRIFLAVKDRKNPVCIPTDTWEILKEFRDQREDHESFFYNSRGRRLNTMYISRMMKKYCTKAGIPPCSAETVRNCCVFNLFAYGAAPYQAAEYMGITQQQIRRYNDESYKNRLLEQPEELVKIYIEKPADRSHRI